MTEQEIQDFHKEIDDIISKSGYALMGVINSHCYTVGLTLTDKPEVIMSFNNGNFLNSIVKSFLDGSKNTLETIYEDSNFHVNGANSRYKLTSVDDEQACLLTKHVALGDRQRYGYNSKFILVQISDKNNILPNEEGYDWVDQSADALIYKCKEQPI